MYVGSECVEKPPDCYGEFFEFHHTTVEDVLDRLTRANAVPKWVLNVLLSIRIVSQLLNAG